MKELLVGMALGVGAGLSPGPLFALVVSASVQRGFPAGARVAVAPLVTDGPIIAVTAFAVGSLPDEVAAGLALAGAAYLFWLGTSTVLESRSALVPSSGEATPGHDLRRAVVVNALSPHPWLFWIGVGVPILLDAWHDAPAGAAAFVAGFYAMLVGCKLVISALVAVGRRRLKPQGYRTAIAVSGGLLLLAGVLLVLDVVRGEFL